jgi:hypothetical protein
VGEWLTGHGRVCEPIKGHVISSLFQRLRSKRKRLGYVRQSNAKTTCISIILCELEVEEEGLRGCSANTIPVPMFQTPQRKKNPVQILSFDIPTKFPCSKRPLSV